MASTSTSFLLLNLFVLSIIAAASSSSSSSSFPINIWPMPTKMEWPDPKSALTIPGNFEIQLPAITNDEDSSALQYLVTAAERYRRLLFTERYVPIVDPGLAADIDTPSLEALVISVSDASAPLQHGVDESYRLTIPASGRLANLSAATVWGAMRGLESFSQITWGIGEVLVAAGVDVDDRPIYPYRGLMLDTGRNFFPVSDILRTISAMGANKLNAFHWHITDTQSFPIVLPSAPELASEGSYGRGMQYSPSDVKRIVEHGLSNGVRVIPEIDAPGHAGSWGGAYPDIVTCANKFWLPEGKEPLAVEPATGQLNPLKQDTYEVYSRVLSDIVDLFPDTFYHAGADEIIPGCWNDDATVRAFIDQRNGTLSEVLETFVNATRPEIVSHGRTVVYWEDVMLNPTIKVSPSSLPPETTILETWNNGPNNTKLITSAGYRVIVSSSDFYYLDCGHGDFTGNVSSYDNQGSDVGTDGGSWCGPFKTWQRIYDYDIAYNLTAEEAALVLGGEVALWTEQVDGEVLDGRVWPRTSAMAESLWSGNRGPNGEKRYAGATDRLTDWRQRMVGRGVHAEPIQPLWCRSRPGMCNLNQ